MGVTKVKLNKDEINKIVCSAFPGQTLAAYIELTEGLCNTAYRLELDNGQKIVLKVTSGRSDGFMTNEVGMMDAEVKPMFMEVWKKLRESYVSVGIATNIS